LRYYEIIFAEKSEVAKYNTYVQQLQFDGLTYTSGDVVDLLEQFKVVCQEFPFKRTPKPKDLPSRDWAGEDGVDVYIPAMIPVKPYEIEVIFLYVGSEQTIRTDLKGFIDFLYGRIGSDGVNGVNGVNGRVQTGRLAIYNEYVGIGRKDVVVSEVENELFYLTDSDTDAIAKFNIKFSVNDPTTEVSPVTGTVNGVTKVTGLSFS